MRIKVIEVCRITEKVFGKYMCFNLEYIYFIPSPSVCLAGKVSGALFPQRNSEDSRFHLSLMV
jgi:hypothetical protein